MLNQLKALVLLLLGLFAGHVYASGAVYKYIGQRYAWLLIIATVLLLLQAFVYFISRDMHHDHDHDHTTGWRAYVPLLIVAMPFLFGVLVPQQALGASALDTRALAANPLNSFAAERTRGQDTSDIDAQLAAEDATAAASAAQADDTAQRSVSATVRRAPTRSILDWTRAFTNTSDPDKYYGRDASVIGFVWRETWHNDDEFALTRYIITCCVADAEPLGFPVQYAGAADLSVGEWVQVNGVLAEGTINGETTPIIIASEVVPTEEPVYPYLESGQLR